VQVQLADAQAGTAPASGRGHDRGGQIVHGQPGGFADGTRLAGQGAHGGPGAADRSLAQGADGGDAHGLVVGTQCDVLEGPCRPVIVQQPDALDEAHPHLGRLGDRQLALQRAQPAARPRPTTGEALQGQLRQHARQPAFRDCGDRRADRRVVAIPCRSGGQRPDGMLADERSFVPQARDEAGPGVVIEQTRQAVHSGDRRQFVGRIVDGHIQRRDARTSGRHG
jgi:hypothetical protein